jgi:uncharacterized protein (TIGR00297 family)
VSAGVSALAWLARTLSLDGSVAAWIIGTAILIGAGWEGGAVLAAFFVSSSLVSTLAGRRASPALDPKGDRRDAWQVIANGGVAALAALTVPDPLAKLWLVTATLAAAAADTWATSTGALSPVPPRLLWSRRRVVAGTSGGVTTVGIIGAVVGSALVSVTGAGVAGAPRVAAAGTLIGFAGMLVDSFVGGTFQGRFHCPRCDAPSEWQRHRCGAETQLIGGQAWLNNDVVNGLATVFAALLAWAWWRLLE